MAVSGTPVGRARQSWLGPRGLGNSVLSTGIAMRVSIMQHLPLVSGSCKLFLHQLLPLSKLYVNVGIYLKTDTDTDMDRDTDRDTDVFLGENRDQKVLILTPLSFFRFSPVL